MITIKQIHNFLVLAEELHFARAAEKLMISQAALSMEIKKLESSLGCKLLDRSDRWQIRLTDAGTAYFQQIRLLPQIMDKALDAARRAERGESGKLSVVVANVVYDSFDVGALFQKMFQKYPQVKLQIQDRLASPQVAELVRSGQCDAGLMAVIHGTDMTSGLRQIKIMDSRICFALPPAHPLAHKADLKLEDLRECNFIFPPKAEAPLMRQNFENFFLRELKTTPVIAHEAVGLRAIKQLVRAGLGVAMIPYDPTEKEVVFRHIRHNMTRSISAVWDESNHSAALRNFLALIPSQSTGTQTLSDAHSAE
jgi:DNA-binding transcriptional LysR family regulator